MKLEIPKEKKVVFLEKFRNAASDEKQVNRDLQLCLSEAVRKREDTTSAVGASFKCAVLDESMEVSEAAMDEQYDELVKFLKTVDLSDLLMKSGDDGMSGFGGSVERKDDAADDEDVAVVDVKVIPAYKKFAYLC